MACSITITPPIKGIVVGGVLTSIEVRGTAWITAASLTSELTATPSRCHKPA